MSSTALQTSHLDGKPINTCIIHSIYGGWVFYSCKMMGEPKLRLLTVTKHNVIEGDQGNNGSANRLRKTNSINE